MIIKIELPIYMKIRKKDKKPKLIGKNLVRNLHHSTKNKIKQHYTELVFAQLGGIKWKRIKGKKPVVVSSMYDPVDTEMELKVKLYYKNKISDLDNVCTEMVKYTLDALQQANLIKNDNVQFVTKITLIVGGQDIDDPRVEMILRRR